MSVDEHRCPACDARNPADASWCTQCFESLATPDTAVAPSSPPPVSAPLSSATTVPSPPPPADRLLPLPPAEDEGAGGAPRTLRAGDGRFRETAEGLEWSCRTCNSWNPIERVTCSVCRTAFGVAVGSDAPEPLPEVAPGLLAAASVVLPGAGHALLRLWGQAFTRSVLALVWGLGGLGLLLNARSSGQPMLPAIPLLGGWFVLVVTSVNDALVEAGVVTGRVLLAGRVLLWLVIGVIGATVAAAFLGAFSSVAG